MSFDRHYLIWALAYAATGMGLGIFMAASHDHVQHVTHAHILLAGFVASFIYAVIHRLWLDDLPRLATLQFILHHAGVVVMTGGLFLLYGDLMPAAQVEPVLAIASFAVLGGLLLMLYGVIISRPARA